MNEPLTLELVAEVLRRHVTNHQYTAICNDLHKQSGENFLDISNKTFGQSIYDFITRSAYDISYVYKSYNKKMSESDTRVFIKCMEYLVTDLLGNKEVKEDRSQNNKQQYKRNEN